MDDFFGFRRMVSTDIIKLSYILGMIGLTISGIFMLLTAGKEMIGFVILIFGNLFWRVICESAIVLFSIHEILLTVEKNLTQKYFNVCNLLF